MSIPTPTTWASLPPGARILDTDGREAEAGAWVDPLSGVRIVNGLERLVRPDGPVIQLVPDTGEIVDMLEAAGFTVEEIPTE